MTNNTGESSLPPSEKRLKKRKRLKRGLRFLAALAFTFSALAFSAATHINVSLPDEFNAVTGQKFALASSEFGVTLKPVLSAKTVSSAVISEKYSVSVFGVIPVKEVTVNYGERRYVVPSGQSFGIRLYSDGVMVVGLAEIDASGQKTSPAYLAGLRSGDVITHIDGQRVYENSDVTERITESGGKRLKITFMRENRAYTAELTPAKYGDSFKAGMWVRDSVAGIGTLTYIDTVGMTFAGLGHGITDGDCGNIYPIASGNAVFAKITACTKGKSGAPGELKGYFTETDIGNLFANTETGIYGRLNGLDSVSDKAIPVAFRQEVKEGEAKILTTVDGGGVKEYTVTVEKVNYNGNLKTRNMVIRVTDRELLDKTGGIVQGMSGSPIIQDGKLIGAVTHVFVNDPTRGYGIFAENMLEATEASLQKAA